MEFGKAYNEKQNKLMDDQSIGPGLYQLDESLKTKLPVYPWAPGSNINVDKQGVNTDYVDAHSELLNLFHGEKNCAGTPASLAARLRSDGRAAPSGRGSP